MRMYFIPQDDKSWDRPRRNSVEVSGPESLGEVLGRTRRGRGICRAEHARRLGMSAANIARIEQGGDMRVSTLLELARQLKLEPILVPKKLVMSVKEMIRFDREGTPPLQRGRFT
jgi:transcriptional regulator with XRE-family HTH domain